MDAVRLGRALGFGTRQAAKTVIRAVDAARAENPSLGKPAGTSGSNPGRPIAATPLAQGSAEPPRIPRPVSATRSIAQPGGVREGLNRFKASAVEPAVRLTGVLWLEVTGVFFALFALGAASGVWRLRAELRPALTHPFAHGSVLGAAAICTLFTYFSISSFVRAHRRQRRR